MERQTRLSAMVHVLGRPHCRKPQYLSRLCVVGSLNCSNGSVVQAAPTSHCPQRYATLDHVHPGHSWALDCYWDDEIGPMDGWNIRYYSKNYLCATCRPWRLEVRFQRKSCEEMRKGIKPLLARTRSNHRGYALVTLSCHSIRPKSGER